MTHLSRQPLGAHRRAPEVAMPEMLPPKSPLFLRGAQMSRIMPAPWPGGPSRLFVVEHG